MTAREIRNQHAVEPFYVSQIGPSGAKFSYLVLADYEDKYYVDPVSHDVEWVYKHKCVVEDSSIYFLETHLRTYLSTVPFYVELKYLDYLKVFGLENDRNSYDHFTALLMYSRTTHGQGVISSMHHVMIDVFKKTVDEELKAAFESPDNIIMSEIKHFGTFVTEMKDDMELGNLIVPDKEIKAEKIPDEEVKIDNWQKVDQKGQTEKMVTEAPETTGLAQCKPLRSFFDIEDTIRKPFSAQIARETSKKYSNEFLQTEEAEDYINSVFHIIRQEVIKGKSQAKVTMKKVHAHHYKRYLMDLGYNLKASAPNFTEFIHYTVSW